MNIDNTESNYESSNTSSNLKNRFPRMVHIPKNNLTYIFWFIQTNPSTTNKIVYRTIKLPSSTVLHKRFLGFARTTVAKNTSLVINSRSAITANQSNLTVGEKYYIQKDGSLKNTPLLEKSIFAGTAISATQLSVQA